MKAYSRSCFLRSPLGAAKTSLNRRWSMKWGWLRHAHAKSTLFFSSNSKWNAFFLNSCKELAAVCTSILQLCCSKFTGMVVPSLHKPETRYMYMCTLLWSHTQIHVHVNGSVHAKSGSHWSHWVSSRLPQRLICTKSPVPRILVIKIKQSLTTDILKTSFHCNNNSESAFGVEGNMVQSNLDYPN